MKIEGLDHFNDRREGTASATKRFAALMTQAFLDSERRPVIRDALRAFPSSVNMQLLDISWLWKTT
jgi:hypothetical protein